VIIMKRITNFLIASLLCTSTLMTIGCSKEFTYNTSKNSFEAPFLATGTKARLVRIDNDIMLPAQATLKTYYEMEKSQKQLQWLQEQKARLVKDLSVLEKEAGERLNDEYLFYGKGFLRALIECLQLNIDIKQAGNQEESNKAKLALAKCIQGPLRDAELGFTNARTRLIHQSSSYALNSLEESRLHKGMTYVELRELLKMPGVPLESFVVTDYKAKTSQKIEPVLWAYNNQFLYVEFVAGKSITWKLYKGIDFGKKADRQVRKQIVSWDKDIVQPVWSVYEKYCKNKNELAKQKIYNAKAAQKQQQEIARALQAVAKAKKELRSIRKDLDGTQVYLEQAELLLKQIEERMQCAQKLAGELKDKKLLRETINKGNSLENWEIWRSYFTYCNALKIKTEGETNYQFPKWAINNIVRKPWIGALMQWFKMPGEHLHKHLVQDGKDPKKWYRHETYVWVQGNGFFYGYFVNDKLIKWQTYCINAGFYNER